MYEASTRISISFSWEIFWLETALNGSVDHAHLWHLAHVATCVHMTELVQGHACTPHLISFYLYACLYNIHH